MYQNEFVSTTDTKMSELNRVPKVASKNKAMNIYLYLNALYCYMKRKGVWHAPNTAGLAELSFNGQARGQVLEFTLDGTIFGRGEGESACNYRR